MARIKGIIPPVVTPMTDKGEINKAALATIIDHLIDKGVAAIFVLGTTGEFWALSRKEKELIYAFTVQCVGGRVPTCAGTCANYTREALELTQCAKEAGVDFVSILSPFFVTPTESELHDHYAAIAEAVALPIMLYSNPGRTHVPVPAPMVARLAERYSNIVGIKDSSGNLTQTMDYIAACPKDFSVLCGCDSIIFSVLQAGGVGAVAASANVFPELVVGIYDSFAKGDLAKSRELQFRLLPYRKAFTLGTFPSIVKTAMNLLGLPAGPTRRPIAPVTDGNLAKLKKIISEIESSIADSSA